MRDQKLSQKLKISYKERTGNDHPNTIQGHLRQNPRLARQEAGSFHSQGRAEGEIRDIQVQEGKFHKGTDKTERCETAGRVGVLG